MQVPSRVFSLSMSIAGPRRSLGGETSGAQGFVGDADRCSAAYAASLEESVHPARRARYAREQENVGLLLLCCVGTGV